MALRTAVLSCIHGNLEALRVRRVEYDIEKAAAKIRSEKALNPRNAERLFAGR